MLERTLEQRPFPAGDSVTARAIRAHDWSVTPLGIPDNWPPALRTALNLMLASPESMYLVWGPELTFFFNDACRPILGLPLDGALGRSLPMLWPDAWPSISDALDRALAGDACRFEDVPITLARDGIEKQTWWTYSFSPLHDEGGQVAGVLCFSRETTAQKQAEREARTSQARQRQLLQQMPGFVAAIAGPDHVFEYVNDAYVRLIGARDYLGNAVRTVLPELAGQGFFELLDRVYITGEPFITQGMPIRLAGEAVDRFVDFIYQPVRDEAGKVTGIFVGGSDTTERVRAETRLKAGNADLEQELNARSQERERNWQISPDLLSIIDMAAGTFDRLNGAWTTHLDWRLDELEGRPFAEFVHPDDLLPSAAALEQVRQGQPVLSFENRYRHRDGSYRWLSWAAVPENGKLYSRALNVTAEKEQAVQLSHAQEQLRQSQKMEAVGQLTGGVAHDFNNLLTVIKSSSDLLKRADLPEERRTRYIDAISNTVDRAAKLTGQLLAFARRQALKPVVFDAAAGVRMVGDMVGTLTGARIRVVANLTDDPCFVNADASQFDTALVNMAVNARDAMSGEGQLTISVRPVEEVPAVRSHVAVSAPYVAISLTDTGSGIATGDIERIFEPFFTTKEVGQGTGLGLSQVFGFAKQSGGEITVSSEVGQGTVFTLYLPRVAPSDAIALPELGATTQDGQGLCVLVVEDNVSVGEFVTQTLAELGYRTNWVPDAQAALNELAESPGAHEIVFSDVVMPGMNGVDLAEEIRRRHPGLPVVLTSGYSHVLAKEGGHGFELLQKPYSVEALSRMLRQAARLGRKPR